MIEPRIPASAYPSHCVAPRYLHVLEAAIHLIKGNLGPGLFAMPLQFATVGPFVGLFCLATVATQGLYCMWLLVHTQQRANGMEAARRLRIQRPVTPTVVGHAAASPQPRVTRPLTFEELGRLAFGSVGAFVVQFCVLWLQLGICAIYISLVAENLQQPLPSGYHLSLSRREAILVAYVPCLALSLLPDLSNLSLASAFGTFAMLVCLGSVVVVSVHQLIVHGGVSYDAFGPPTPPMPPALPPAPPSLPLSPPVAPPPVEPRPEILSLAACAAAAFYAFEGMSIVLPVGNALAPDSPEGRGYAKLVLLAMGSVAAIFAIVALSASLAFPRIDTASITAFLAARYTGAAGSYFEAMNLIVSAAVVATFPLQLTPAAQLFDSGLGLTAFFPRLLVRAAIVSCCGAVVLLVRDLAQLINLVGSVANTALAMLPALIHARLLLSRPDFRRGGGRGAGASGERTAGRQEAVNGNGSDSGGNGHHALSVQRDGSRTAVSPRPRSSTSGEELFALQDACDAEMLDVALTRDEWFALALDLIVVLFCLGLMGTGVAAEAWGTGKAEEGFYVDEVQRARA